jgi:preprotein translocase subunit SecE
MTAPVKFLQETYSELKQVVWPSRSEVIRLTLIVITISLIVGIYLGGVDFVLVKLTEAILR